MFLNDARLEDNQCQLVKYDAGRNFEPNGLYPPGNVSVLWRMQYSPDKCYVNFRGIGNYGQVKEICGRFGGKIPEVRSLMDLDRMAEAAQGMLHFTK